jgi:tRNA(Arg) A34 adenosine deaminase TadA
MHADEHGPPPAARQSPSAGYMEQALAAAAEAAAAGDVPVGAVLIEPSGATVAAAGNRVERDHDPTAHAEMLVLRAGAARLGTARLAGCDLYVTLEPCPMCAAAISFARLRRLHFAALDPKGGGVEHGAKAYTQPTCHHRPEVISGAGADRSAELLRAFFRERR